MTKPMFAAWFVIGSLVLGSIGCSGESDEPSPQTSQPPAPSSESSAKFKQGNDIVIRKHGNDLVVR